MRPFWWAWPSWKVEFMAGAIMQLSLHAWGATWHPPLLSLSAGLAVSVTYELWLDRHGWSWRDVLQRIPGQLAGELLWIIGAFVIQLA